MQMKKYYALNNPALVTLKFLTQPSCLAALAALSRARLFASARGVRVIGEEPAFLHYAICAALKKPEPLISRSTGMLERLEGMRLANCLILSVPQLAVRRNQVSVQP